MLRPLTAVTTPASTWDERTLTEIYQQYSPPLYRYAYRLLGEAGEAEDMVAETFRRFLQALRRGQGPHTHLSAYLYRVLHNLITDHYRRHPPPDHLLDSEVADAGLADPAQTSQARLTQAQARALLGRLTPEQRFVILLKYFEGMSNDEIALALEKPVSAVKALQHRALMSLRRCLRREGWSSEGGWP